MPVIGTALLDEPAVAPETESGTYQAIIIGQTIEDSQVREPSIRGGFLTVQR
jgi:hypothetical protein